MTNTLKIDRVRSHILVSMFKVGKIEIKRKILKKIIMCISAYALLLYTFQVPLVIMYAATIPVGAK